MSEKFGIESVFKVMSAGLIVALFMPLMVSMITNPIKTINRTQEIMDYYNDPDYFILTGKIVDVKFIHAGNWPLMKELTQVQLDSGEIIFILGWKRGIILMQEYEFGYEKTYSGEYDLTYPDYIKHIPNGERVDC